MMIGICSGILSELPSVHMERIFTTCLWLGYRTVVPMGRMIHGVGF
jgi:hypothetical protein